MAKRPLDTTDLMIILFLAGHLRPTAMMSEEVEKVAQFRRKVLGDDAFDEQEMLASVTILLKRFALSTNEPHQFAEWVGQWAIQAAMSLKR